MEKYKKSYKSGNKNIYQVRVNCVSFQDLFVKAKNKEEAKKIAEERFCCDGGYEGEFCEFLEFEKDDIPKEEENEIIWED